MMQVLHSSLILLCLAVLVSVTIRTLQDWWIERQREHRQWDDAEHRLLLPAIKRIDRGVE